MTEETPALPKKRIESSQIILWVLYAIVGLFVVGWAVTHLGGDTDESDAKAACRYFVEDRLVAPATADFGELSARVGDRGVRWTVAGTVDAENRLGVPLRLDFTCVVEHDGGDWVLVRLIGLD